MDFDKKTAVSIKANKSLHRHSLSLQEMPGKKMKYNGIIDGDKWNHANFVYIRNELSSKRKKQVKSRKHTKSRKQSKASLAETMNTA